MPASLRPSLITAALANRRLPEALEHLTRYGQGTGTTEGAPGVQLRAVLTEARQCRSEVSALRRAATLGPWGLWPRLLAGFLGLGVVAFLAPYLLDAVLGDTAAPGAAATTAQAVVTNIRWVLMLLGAAAGALLILLLLITAASTRRDRAQLRRARTDLDAAIAVLETTLRGREGARDCGVGGPDSVGRRTEGGAR